MNSSTIYSNNNNNSTNNTNNLLNNLNQANNWRNNLISVTLTPASTGTGSNTTSNNNSSAQKHGAERLFAYLEADGSDPEDYNRYFY